jgi:hypothetical protein
MPFDDFEEVQRSSGDRGRWKRSRPKERLDEEEEEEVPVGASAKTTQP